MFKKRDGMIQVKQKTQLITRKIRWVLISLLALTFYCSPVYSGKIRVAVASNFAGPIQEIASQFENYSGHEVVLAFGSTGKHYAQIKNGAPFEVFIAADVDRPKKLEEEGLAQPGSRFTYAFGKLILWSPQSSLVDERGEVLKSGSFTHIAIANPRHAPYGKAARQILEAKGVWGKLQDRIVRGENIGQAFQFIKSGNAALGLIAYSQIKKTDKKVTGSFWIPPQALYSPVEQQAVLLKDNSTAREFLIFFRSEQARMIIQTYGYGIP